MEIEYLIDKNMDAQLLKVRLVSFGYGLISLGISALIGILTSPDFSALVTSHFGSSIFVGVALLAIDGLVKHLRNLQTMKTLGAVDENKVFI